MDPHHLLDAAANLAQTNARRPRRADLCRAASTVYYAMFHCLARSCADGLAGQAGAVGNRPMWRRVYRALDHADARKRCLNVPPSFPAEVRDFGQRFAELQRKRHLADYDPDRPFRKTGVLVDINSARTAIDRFLETPPGVRRDFAIHVLMRERADG